MIISNSNQTTIDHLSLAKAKYVIYIVVHVICIYESSGIGEIPDAVLRNLHDHRGLGIHSEMLSDGIIDLIEMGAITNGAFT